MTPAEILSALPSLSALVIGDVCLDRWCTYDPLTSEPSRETGIPRIGVVSTQTTPGAGLGLYICKIITKAHSGHIWARNRVPGGSSFYFSLPLQ